MMTTEKIAMHWINGEWVDSNPHRESIVPATYQVIGSYADGGVEVAVAAIAAARRAFEATEWKRDALLRARVLEELAASFERQTDSLVEQLALENGNVRTEASFEVNMVPSKLRYYATVPASNAGTVAPPGQMYCPSFCVNRWVLRASSYLGILL
jgi:betaine-aldehyde dehydrogenase